MILRRFMQHVREQNWTAVGLDFAIVVLGVFLGFQLTSWNENLQERGEIAQSLSGVANEIATSMEYRRDHARYMRNVRDGLELALAAAQGEELDEEQMAKAYGVLASTSSPPPEPGRYEALRELRETGYLRRVDPVELRLALTELLALTQVTDDFARSRESMMTAPDFDPAIVTYEVAKGARSDDSRNLRAVSVDWQAARRDPAFRLRLQQAITRYSYEIEDNVGARKFERRILGLLKSEGYEPTRNLLWDWVAEEDAKFEEARKDLKTLEREEN